MEEERRRSGSACVWWSGTRHRKREQAKRGTELESWKPGKRNSLIKETLQWSMFPARSSYRGEALIPWSRSGTLAGNLRRGCGLQEPARATLRVGRQVPPACFSLDCSKVDRGCHWLYCTEYGVLGRILSFGTCHPPVNPSYSVSREGRGIGEISRWIVVHDLIQIQMQMSSRCQSVMATINPPCAAAVVKNGCIRFSVALVRNQLV